MKENLMNKLSIIFEKQKIIIEDLKSEIKLVDGIHEILRIKNLCQEYNELELKKNIYLNLLLIATKYDYK